MKKLLFSLILATTTTLSYAHEDTTTFRPNMAQKVFSPNEAEYLAPEAVETGYLAVKGMKIEKFNDAGLAKVEAAFAVLEKVVNSEEFKERVINFKNDKGERAFASNNGLTNEEIYEKFMEGRETLQPNTPGEMNFYLRLYNKSWSRVIGYTNATTNVINVNWKFFKNFTPDQVASNLAHEWTHKIGFDHRSAAERDSAPYAIGYIVGDIAAKYLAQTKLH